MAYTPHDYLENMAPYQSPCSHMFIDPTLKDPSMSCGNDPWTAHLFPYSPTELEQNLYHTPRSEAPFTSNNIRRVDGPTLFPSALVQRQTTPSDHYSACSSARSPRTGSDYDPPTPRDDWALSPIPTGYEAWGPHAPALQLTGLTHNFVKPGDVNLYQESISSYGEDRNIASPLRGLSTSSSEFGLDQTQFSHIEQIQLKRQLSPEEIKDEIHVSDLSQTETYPPLELQESKTQPLDGIEMAQEDDEEEETFRLSGPRERIVSNSNQSSASRKRTNRPLAQPQPKKLKVESLHQRSTSKTPSKKDFSCTECSNITFNDENGLRKHIKQQHTRPFVCVFGFAGCGSTFASKNEWKRHVASQHLLLHYWLCQQEGCAKQSNADGTSSKNSHRHRTTPTSAPLLSSGASTTLPNGAIFNRKDLYTQHLRRMHVPPSFKKQVKQRRPVPEWEDRIRAHQDEAQKVRCELPERMACPAVGCNHVFVGPHAWDERMEHVAKHLERAANGDEPLPAFGGENDPTLVEWASAPNVAIIKAAGGRGGWTLNSVLKQEKSSSSKSQSGAATYSEEDAPGEDIDE